MSRRARAVAQLLHRTEADEEPAPETLRELRESGAAQLTKRTASWHRRRGRWDELIAYLDDEHVMATEKSVVVNRLASDAS